MTCDKRAYKSKHHAREAVRTMGNSVRVYRCEDCGHWHTTKQRYGGPWRREQKRKRYNEKVNKALE